MRWGAAVAAAAACLLLAGCGAPADVAPVLTPLPAATAGSAPTATLAPTTSPHPTAAPAVPHPTAGASAASTRLPWPSATPEGAVTLQHQVDDGAQPWLLDPVEVAQSYAASLGWREALASGGGSASPTHVIVRSSAGSHTLTLTQPGTRGPSGIWLVTADSGP